MIWLLVIFSFSAYGNDQLKDLKPFYAGFDWIRVTLALVFIITFLALVFNRLKKRFRKKKVQNSVTPIEEALHHIENLPVDNLKRGTFQISMIIRRLFDSMFYKLNLSERTTKEIRAQRTNIATICGEEQLEELISFLQACDEVKYRPDSHNNPLEELKKIALNIIEKLKQKEKDV